MIDFLEICRRASAGPLVQESKFDRELLFPTVMDLVKKYEIRHDLENPVNQANGLADAIYEAAVDLIADVGVYCTGTQRVIEFSRDEVLGGFGTHPAPVG